MKAEPVAVRSSGKPEDPPPSVRTPVSREGESQPHASGSQSVAALAPAVVTGADVEETSGMSLPPVSVAVDSEPHDAMSPPIGASSVEGIQTSLNDAPPLLVEADPVAVQPKADIPESSSAPKDTGKSERTTAQEPDRTEPTDLPGQDGVELLHEIAGNAVKTRLQIDLGAQGRIHVTVDDRESGERHLKVAVDNVGLLDHFQKDSADLLSMLQQFPQVHATDVQQALPLCDLTLALHTADNVDNDGAVPTPEHDTEFHEAADRGVTSQNPGRRARSTRSTLNGFLDLTA